MKTYKMKFYKAPYGILYLSLSAILLVTLTAFFNTYYKLIIIHTILSLSGISGQIHVERIMIRPI